MDVAEKLRQTLLKNYHKDVKLLKRRFTFSGVLEILSDLEDKLYKHVIRSYKTIDLSQEIVLNELYKAKEIVVNEHKSLFIDELNDFITKVKIFGFHFACLDIRQDSRVHHDAFSQMVNELLQKEDKTFPENYQTLTEIEQIEVLSNVKGEIDPANLMHEISVKTMESMHAIKTIQERNGELGANRYIISNNQSALNIMQTFAMLNLCGFSKPLPVDIIPLFETVEDLQNAETIMRTVYSNTSYRKHLTERKNKQTEHPPVSCGVASFVCCVVVGRDNVARTILS